MLSKEIELLALRTELEGMISDNRLRELQGSSLAWGGTEFDELAKKIRAISEPGPESAKPDPWSGWTPRTLVAEARKRNPYTKKGSNSIAYGICCLSIEDLIREGKK